VDAERLPELRLRRGQGDERVAWRRPQALPGPVHHDRRADPGDRRPRGEQPDLGEGGQRVPDPGDELAPLHPVRDVPADEAQQRGRAGVQPVDHAVHGRAEVQPGHEVQRQDRRHHLAGDVGDEADRAEGEDVAADHAQPALVPDPAARPIDGGQVHRRSGPDVGDRVERGGVVDAG
jgi:hypothetical protein